MKALGKDTYRITNKAKITPIITTTEVPSAPPRITGKLSEEDMDSFAFFLMSRETGKSICDYTKSFAWSNLATTNEILDSKQPHVHKS